MGGFEAVESVWTARLGNLRNVVRQEMIARQLAEHVRPGMTVLDAGCGQGTQALRLAARGCPVTGVDPSAELLELFRAGAKATGVHVELERASVADLESVLANRRFDVVCAHGLLMYLPDRASALQILAGFVAEDGVLSVTFRNATALAFRPAMRRDWPAALEAFDRHDYVNELGAHARADTLAGVTAELGHVGFRVDQWYGVRVFTDPDPGDRTPPAADELAALLAVEDRAGRTDPYRHFASQLHVIARPIAR